MQNTLIINARRQLRWHHRLCSDATTFALWGMWLWLCRPVVFAGAGLLGVVLGMRHPPFKLVTMGAHLSFEGTAIALAATACFLMLWNRLASQPALRPLLTVVPDYAACFGIDAQLIAAGRNSKICVVHHDEQGRITSIEPRPLSHPPESLLQLHAA